MIMNQIFHLYLLSDQVIDRRIFEKMYDLTDHITLLPWNVDRMYEFGENLMGSPSYITGALEWVSYGIAEELRELEMATGFIME